MEHIGRCVNQYVAEGRIREIEVNLLDVETGKSTMASFRR